MKSKKKPKVDQETQRRYDAFVYQASVLEESMNWWVEEMSKLSSFLDSIDEENGDSEITAAQLDWAKKQEQILSYRSAHDELSLKQWNKEFDAFVKELKT